MTSALLLYGIALDLAVLLSLVMSAREMGWVVVDVIRIEVKVISLDSRRGK